MPERKSRFVLFCQQAFACAVVGAVGVSAIGVVELEIIAPAPEPAVEAFPAGPMSLVSSAPVKPTVRTVPLAGASAGRSSLPGKSGSPDRGPQEIRVVSEPQPVSGYATVGVTWAADQEVTEEDVAIEVRTLVDGTWSEWQEMHFDPAHQPDPGTEGTDDSEVRGGTDAVVVGDVDDVQVRAVTDSGATPEGLALAIVDPGEDVAPVEEAPAIDTAAASTASAATDSDDAAVLTANGMPTAPRPKIFSRAQWGADERLRNSGSLRYGEIHAGFVHHTVNANDYTKEQVPSILRGIYAYHTKSRGWSDVGYNFLVDRFGQIWEGRYGGVDRPVIGAHTLGYNEEAFAMSAIGNFDVAQPSAAMLKAYGRLFAWKLSLHGIAADDRKQWVDDRYLAAINGHRDAGSTACPGQYLYAQLAEIRKQATAIQQGAGSSEPPKPEPEPEPEPPKPEPEPEPEPPKPVGPGKPLDANLSGSRWPDLVVRDAKTKRALIIRTHGQFGFDDGTTVARKWGKRDLVVAAGDLDGDGVGDVVARRASGVADLYLGTQDGTLRRSGVNYERFAGVDQLTGGGDFDGDGNADLVGRRADTGQLVLFPGRGDGRFGSFVELAADWSAYDLTTGVGDFDGDGRADLVARSGETLQLVPGRRAGRRVALGTPVSLPGRWGGFDVLTGGGDATADGLPDLLARRADTGLTYVYPGNGAGGVMPRMGGWERYSGIGSLALGGQLAGSDEPDLIGLNGHGALRVFENTGRRNVGEPLDTGVVLDDIDLLLNVGDWNRDGRGDVMTRQASTGALQLRLGLRGNRLAAPTTVATRWGSVSRVAAVGDVTGDGNPDLAGRAADGTDRIYPGDGRAGLQPSYVARSTEPGRTQVGVGFWDEDLTPDTALRRTDGSLWLWRSQRSKSEQVADGLRRYDWVRGLGDLDGDGRADLVVRTRARGDLFLLPGQSSGFGARRLIATGFSRYDYAG